MNFVKYNDSKAERGYMLIGVLFILSLSMIVTTGLMSSSSSYSKIRTTVETQSDSYYEVEKTLGKVVGWMQANSKYLVTPFTAANFDTNFDLGAPLEGDNEGLSFAVPTMVKMNGTNDSVMLSNNDFFGESAFPTTTHIDTSASFDPVAQFENADFGSANARVILVWARLTNGNYEPIFRVDVITGNNPDRGVHSFSYIYSALESTVASSPVEFYGQLSLTTNTSNNQCNSYKYTYASGAWSKGAVQANCHIASASAVSLKSRISGNAASLINLGIILSGSGLVSGTTCMGPTCHTVTPSSFSPWATACAINQGDLTISSDTTLTPTGSSPAQNCWQDITVNANRTLTLDSTTYDYHIRTLTLTGNAQLKFATVAPGSKITVYLNQITGNNINGGSVINTNNAPQVLKLNYTGTNALTLNGTADSVLCLDAPLADVGLNGNFNFYGGIKAKNLSATGNARFNADEDGCGAVSSTETLTDINFSLRKASQRYRLYS